ncbi:MAG: hypothetical protein EPN50_03695, partial [Chloroflexota bacterium]
MNPAEFFFLAVGLLLGLAAGAAVLDVLRARPPSPEVHLTITRDALPRREGAGSGAQVAAGDPVAPGDAIAASGAITAAGAVAAGGAGTTAGAVAAGAALAGGGLARRSGADRTDGRIPISVSRGVDPTLAALRAVARERKPVLATADRLAGVRRPFDLSSDAARGHGETVLRPSASTARSTSDPSGGEHTMGLASARPGPADLGPTDRAATATRQAPASASQVSASASQVPTSASQVPNSASQVPTSPGRPRSRGGASPAPPGPCSAERLLSEERCAVASQARERAEEVASELRRTQRAYDEATARAEAAALASDPRLVADAKEAARQKFRAASGAARARADLEAAATGWLTEINRINRDRREASETAATARQAAAGLLGDIERLTLAADASRITAAAASSACLEARQLLADCEEAVFARRPAPSRAATPAPSGAATPAPSRAATPAPSASAAEPLLEALQRPPDGEAAAGGTDGGTLPAAPSYRGDDHEPAIFRLLQGDRRTLIAVVDSLAGSDREERQRTQRLL